MKTIEMLKVELGTLKALAEKAAKLTAKVNKEWAAINDDKSRTPVWKGPKLAEIRDAGRDLMVPLWHEIKARYDELVEERIYWDSPMLVLSQYGLKGFMQGSPEEMTVRGQVVTEFKMQHPAILRLEAEGAARERDWARLYLALLVLQEKGIAPPVNLGVLPIGLLVDADELFFEADLAYRKSELDLLSIRGQGSNVKTIALGLLLQRQEDLRRARAEGLSLNWDERRALEKSEKDDPSAAVHQPIPLDIHGD